MKVYITASSAITPQDTFDLEKYLVNWQSSEMPYLVALEPDYKHVIDPKLARRMSRIIKMSVAAGNRVLTEAGIEQPNAIVVGTGLGCIKDTEKFLSEIINEREGLLSPTAFIQSTHNTIAGQLALMLQCSNDNFTYVNRGHSFENALFDAILRIHEGANHILLGGADEMTPQVHHILQKMGCDNKIPFGEGACFFMISASGRENSVCIENMANFRDLSPEEVTEVLDDFLTRNSLYKNEIGALVLGFDENSPDAYYENLISAFAEDIPVVGFKKVTGEYFTASAYAYNLGAEMLRKQCVFSDTLMSGTHQGTLSKVLIYNHYKGENHTISLLSL
ncbi:beta-ketoacyl synthase chain length factor [Fulvivirga ulvae]|uniref:beta-ketoacyl synthase chain length factor n=1 Tax=Fulvivirga ulvae TaxID=2904245 RepID=UPI001F37D274|nr:beta-ketoacyl synthase chain length factor [Fulvivirga ulvae]UII34793.1 beta-ketoacyl synthase chain length factor [Fulvivirga ulvae]